MAEQTLPTETQTLSTNAVQKQHRMSKKILASFCSGFAIYLT